MKKKPMINTLVVAISVVALAGAALFVVDGRQNGDVTVTETAQTSQDKAASVSILVGGLEASVGVDRTWFRLDTTHRAGDEIVREREPFGNWTARVELTHRILQI